MTRSTYPVLSEWVDLSTIGTYEDMKIALKKCNLKLHPDRGGNTDDYVRFKTVKNDFDDGRMHWSRISERNFRLFFARYVKLDNALRTGQIKDILDWQIDIQTAANMGDLYLMQLDNDRYLF